MLFSLLKPESKELCIKVYDEDPKKGSLLFWRQIHYQHSISHTFPKSFLLLTNSIVHSLDDFIGQVLIDIDSLKVCNKSITILFSFFKLKFENVFSLFYALFDSNSWNSLVHKDGATYEQWLNLMPKANRTEGSIHLILKYFPNATENFIVQGLSFYSLQSTIKSSSSHTLSPIWTLSVVMQYWMERN
jgi:hypothetical protein